MELFDLNIHFPVTDPTWIFFLVLIIILFAPMILGRLRIPHIIGMILAGVVVGKYGFNILERDSSFELFGKVGLYYIMFLAGLEMDMDDFKKNHRLMRGIKNMISPNSKTTLATNSTQNSPPTSSPLYIPPITASTIKASTTVTAVPPIVILTVRCRDKPYRLIIG